MRQFEPKVSWQIASRTMQSFDPMFELAVARPTDGNANSWPLGRRQKVDITASETCVLNRVVHRFGKSALWSDLADLAPHSQQRLGLKTAQMLGFCATAAHRRIVRKVKVVEGRGAGN